MARKYESPELVKINIATDTVFAVSGHECLPQVYVNGVEDNNPCGYDHPNSIIGGKGHHCWTEPY